MRAFSTKLFLIALVAAFLLSLAAAAQGGLRYTVNVTKFENKAGWHGSLDLGDALRMEFTNILQQTAKFIVLGEIIFPVFLEIVVEFVIEIIVFEIVERVIHFSP